MLFKKWLYTCERFLRYQLEYYYHNNIWFIHWYDNRMMIIFQLVPKKTLAYIQSFFEKHSFIITSIGHRLWTFKKIIKCDLRHDYSVGATFLHRTQSLISNSRLPNSGYRFIFIAHVVFYLRRNCSILWKMKSLFLSISIVKILSKIKWYSYMI